MWLLYMCICVFWRVCRRVASGSWYAWVSGSHQRYEHPTPRSIFDSLQRSYLNWSFSLKLVQWAFFVPPRDRMLYLCNGRFVWLTCLCLFAMVFMIDIVCMIDINIFVWREKAPLDIYVVIDDCMLCKNKMWKDSVSTWNAILSIWMWSHWKSLKV